MQGEIHTVWQISAGYWGNSYSELCLRYGVALIGPGDAGPWEPDRQDDEFGGGFVRWFANEVAVGDVLLLRTGLQRVRAIGVVASDYAYLDQFDDVNGWDLQHARRVRWFQLPVDFDFGRPVFGGSRFSRVSDAEVLEYAKKVINSPPTYWQTAFLPRLPEEEPALEPIPQNLCEMVAKVQDLAPLMWDRGEFGEEPSEAELVGHFVVPFLRASGWLPEQIAVEWRSVDVAVFDRLPRTPESCRFVLEAKRLRAGGEDALEQAKGYLRDLGIDRDIIVTDGVRYRLYNSQVGYRPIAYANLLRLKRPATALFSRMARP